MKYLLWSVAIVALMLGRSYTASAQTEVTLLAPRPVQEQMEKLIAGFESRTGYKVKPVWGSGLGTKQQVANGEGGDVSIMFAPFPEAVASGNVVPGSGITLARLVMGLSVRKGAPKADISTADAVRRTLLAAKSIVTVDPAQGSVGVSALAVLQKLGIADQVRPKLKFVQNGGLVQTAVAKGEVDIALGPYIGDTQNPGLDLAGPLPRDASTPTDVAGFVSAKAKDSAAARAFLDYLASPDAMAVYRAAGMEPAR